MFSTKAAGSVILIEPAAFVLSSVEGKYSSNRNLELIAACMDLCGV